VKTRWLILVIILAGCAPTGLTGLSTIDSSCDLCIVDGELNGKKTYFLLDTGAGLTTLDKNQSKSYSFTVSNYLTMEVGGFTNDVGTVHRAYDVKSIRISSVEVLEPVIYSSDLGNLVEFIEKCTRKKISGIIGMPVLKRHELVIDLSCDKIYKSAVR
jgi:hypothetical protein